MPVIHRAIRYVTKANAKPRNTRWAGVVGLTREQLYEALICSHWKTLLLYELSDAVDAVLAHGAVCLAQRL